MTDIREEFKSVCEHHKAFLGVDLPSMTAEHVYSVGRKVGAQANQAEIDALKAEVDTLKDRELKTAWACHYEIIGQQAAVIEMFNGDGANSAMQWIINGLTQKGFMPDLEDNADAQEFYDDNYDRTNGK